MKKRIVSIIIVALTLLFTGCVKNNGTYMPIENNDDRFQIIYTQDLDQSSDAGRLRSSNVRILYDKETKIKYMYVSEKRGYGSSVVIIKLEE